MRALLLTTMLVTALTTSATHADEYTNSRQLSQIGLDQAIQNFGNNGRNIAIAFIDTGINASHNEFSGRVLPFHSTCVATNNCGAGYADTNFHGTFVASIASGALNGGNGIVGVAPQSAIMAIKIAQPNGNASTTDLNRGLLAAAQRGTHIINLSYSSFFGPRSSSFYTNLNSQLVGTLNSIAAIGQTTVLAGGNSGKTFVDNVNIAGFTQAALTRMLFVGSVNSQNQLSTFSNTPGTTNLSSVDGLVVPLRSLWLVAPGENLTGAHVSGVNNYATGSGTSFSTPLVSGALALLESRWPVLYRTGGASQVLLYTATDLGAPGRDEVYGAGLLNLNKAFQPFGKVYVPNLKGQFVDVTQISGSLLASGAFGALHAIQSRLGTINSYDAFGRDFIVNLSGVIQTAPTAPTISLPHGTQIVVSNYNFANGGGLSYAETISTIPDYFSNHDHDNQEKNFYLSLTNEDGRTTAGGFGYSATPSFAEALWGYDSESAASITKLGISNELLSTAQGGGFFAYGDQINSQTRYALSWSQTSSTEDITSSLSQDLSSANAIGFGIKHKMNSSWDAGITFNVLDENNQWFGSTYANSPIAFGDEHRTVSVGLASSFDLGNDKHLTFDAVVARGDGTDVQNSLIENVSDVYAAGIGMTYAQKHTFKKDDKISIGIKQPMRVFKGSADVTFSSVDENGDINFSSESVNLEPNGHEVDLTLNYSAPIDEHTTWSTNLSARHDENNIQGNDSASMMVSAKIRF